MLMSSYPLFSIGLVTLCFAQLKHKNRLIILTIIQSLELQVICIQFEIVCTLQIDFSLSSKKEMWKGNKKVENDY